MHQSAYLVTWCGCIGTFYILQKKLTAFADIAADKARLWRSPHLFSMRFLITFVDGESMSFCDKLFHLITCWPRQWEMANFDSLRNRHFSTDHRKIVTGDYDSDFYSCVKCGANSSTGRLQDEWVKCNQILCIYTVSQKKGDTILLSISLLNIDWFS